MENQKQKRSAALGIVNVIRTIMVYLLAIAIVIAAILFAMDKSPQKSIFGYRYYTVLTPSMEPAYSVGDIVIVKLANADDIKVGDVITFNPSSDSDAYLTHRVTEKLENYEGTGVTCFKTKGDANETEDSFLIDSKRVIGTVSFGIPKVGYIVRFVQLRWYIVLPLAVMLIVLLKLVKVYISDGETEDSSDEKGEAAAKEPAAEK
ncbi:MAG: signal peptidase I [Oscillospiraceae bacterium]